MKEVKDALDSLLQAQMDAADARRREQSAELVRQSYTRQREDESTRLEKANNEIKDLEQEIISVRHEIQRRVKAPGTDLKAAPFQSAASLKTLAAYTDVVILIVTPHWLGVETPQGQRGWLPVSQLEQLP
jgi:chromosome segregation ATPase